MTALALVYFMQEGCAPCDRGKPVAEIVAEASGLPLAFVDAKAERNAVLVEAYRVRSTPTLVLENHDGRVAAWSGKLIKADAVLKVIERFRRDG